MAITHTVSCDICGTQRKEANHWFTYLSQAGQVTFYPWSESNIPLHGHLCSERCCMTVLSRTLASWSRQHAA